MDNLSTLIADAKRNAGIPVDEPLESLVNSQFQYHVHTCTSIRLEPHTYALTHTTSCPAHGLIKDQHTPKMKLFIEEDIGISSCVGCTGDLSPLFPAPLSPLLYPPPSLPSLNSSSSSSPSLMHDIEFNRLTPRDAYLRKRCVYPYQRILPDPLKDDTNLKLFVFIYIAKIYFPLPKIPRLVLFWTTSVKQKIFRQ